EQFSLGCDDLTFDYSKHRVNQDIIQSLVAWAEAKDLKEWIKQLFSQELINYTEQRAAMHWALRLPKNTVQFSELSMQVNEQLDRMFRLVEKIHAGQYRGVTGEVIQD
ncbi:glucose-6-phosphate isomerase, partial [Salmonella enterica subsp. enterica]|nr:glucose-6-phosphate isomerase [Salmonella enterica subsp. enterica serovar Paratyphi A]